MLAQIAILVALFCAVTLATNEVAVAEPEVTGIHALTGLTVRYFSMSSC